MIISIIIGIINDIIWIFPIFRNWKTRFSYYFIILGVTGPLAIFLTLVFHVALFKTYIISSLILIPVILNFKLSKKHNSAALTFYFLIVFVTFFIKINQSPSAFLTIMFIHLIIFLIFLKLFLEETRGKISFKLFYVILLLYEATLVLKFALTITSTMEVRALYFLSTAFTSLIAVFFIIYNEENSPVIKLKSKIKIPE